MNRLACALIAGACLFTAAAVPLRAPAATVASPPAASESFDSGMLHVDKYGTGAKSIVFIPGLASGTWTWTEQIYHFSPKYTVYAVTLPGFDGRPINREPDLFAAFARDFFAMLDAHKIEKPIVVGHSLGGTLAILLAEQHSDRLSGIVAVDGLPVFPAAAQMTPEQRNAMGTSAAATLSGMTHDQLIAYETKYMAAIGTTNAALATSLAQRTARSDPDAIAAWAKQDVETDLRADLPKVTVPFVEIMPYASPSSYTQADTLHFYEMLVNGAPRVTVVPIEPARHFAMLDQPQQFDADLTQFLSTVP